LAEANGNEAILFALFARSKERVGERSDIRVSKLPAKHIIAVPLKGRNSKPLKMALAKCRFISFG
jgi:hypothetical protein